MARTTIDLAPIGTADQCGVIATADHRGPLADWLGSAPGAVDQLVHEHGAVVLRGFTMDGVDEMRDIVARLSGEPLAYTERSSPRSAVIPGVYTSTDHPPSQRIFLHNEQSYNLRFPRRLYFHCVTAPDEGGQTLLADCRRIHDSLPGGIRERLGGAGYRLVRNYRPHLGLGWQEAFQTADRADVARYCAANDIEMDWFGPDELRTTQLRRTIARHPETGSLCWFNHATFFHVTTLGAEMADLLTEAYGSAGLPTNTYYGDGTPIEPEVLDLLRAAYERECVKVPWQEGDLLVIDNMLVAHGRAPYRGARRVVVSMAGTSDWRTMA
jgi:alpha-ketoglutarate-dependent taurine dioxygenase